MTTRHLHESANALLYRALDLPPDQRQQFIAESCEGDAALLELVRTMLARINELDEFIESPLEMLAVAQPAVAAPAPLPEPEPEPEPEPVRRDAIVQPEAAAEAVDAPPERGLWQRHPLGMTVAALCACALVGLTSASLWHARQADLARAAAEQRLPPSGKPVRAAPYDNSSALAKIPAAAREKFVATAETYHGELADVRRAGGDLAGAQTAALVSLGFAEQQSQAHPDDARWRRQMAAAQGRVGAILVEQGNNAEGLAQLRKSLATREQIAAGDAGNELLARDVADAHAVIGNALMGTMDYASAEPQFAAARATYAAQLRANPADAGLHEGLIELELARANVQNLQHHGRDAVATLAALHVLARDGNKAGVDAYLAARVALLDAHIQPRGTPAQAYAAGQLALGELVKETEKDPLDTARLRESAVAWQTTGEIGLRAGQAESACRYLGLAAKRYDELETSRRLNAIDRVRVGQLQALRKACS